MSRLTDELILDALERVVLPMPCHEWLEPVRKDPGQLVWPVNTPYG